MAETNNNKRVTFRLKSEKKKGLALLIYDLKQPKLIPVKLLTFIILSGKFYPFTHKKKKFSRVFRYFAVQAKRSTNKISISLLSLYLPTGVGVLLPFTTIHMKSLGMSFKEVGAIYGVSSVGAILSPFIIGLIVDNLGNFKVTHISISFTSICLFKLVLVIDYIGIDERSACLTWYHSASFSDSSGWKNLAFLS